MVRTGFPFGGSYEPEVVDAMSRALQCVCTRLKLPDTATGARRMVARRVIALAGRGEHSAERLCAAVLSEAGMR